MLFILIAGWGLHKIFFFRFNWCLLKDCLLSCDITVFLLLAIFIVVASASANHSSFKGDLKDCFRKIKISFFFGSGGFSSKIVDLVATSLIFLVL